CARYAGMIHYYFDYW
nr:immunoglobulin heavy chain junction region [Macaca mulatta]MOW86680.1 immunoglobulin heavy chain junction region [Macaca mulatta]MOW87160.1 immunoglobulin heavy chain junction region [Macaca mulatta]MOW88053.1 immunoglobulin heavy chain junction region [Macaca mulatta]MOW88511.1 immunoglobulin heavy chain junction region [Macaca mulatta]